MTDAPENLVLVHLRRLEEKVDKLARNQVELHQAVTTNLQYTQRLGTRMGELRDDLEVMLKAETMGASLSWRRELEGRIEALESELLSRSNH
ncbi:hypothetical protein [Acetobacter lambici]|jgi:hypothetical protein|uniref:Uncharacterized protein n=1 Tax=Acetobacter lambici TaxID=1332824 RepID=A0ABT1F4Z1_9PROT|nr:hypothetical protein [Acetobacter lambici]MCP1243906.1 hypothetical protein [Acetobacter lambici]MCP1260026.1 hypothetical protein [Acetobacter lambici]